MFSTTQPSVIKQILTEYDKSLQKSPELEQELKIATYHKIINAYKTVFSAHNEASLFERIINDPSAGQYILNELAQQLIICENLGKSWYRIKGELKHANRQIKIPEETGQNVESIKTFLESHKEDCQRVAQLDLSRLQLREIPKEIFTYFTGLQELDISGNLLSSIPPEIEALVQTRGLQIRRHN